MSGFAGLAEVLGQAWGEDVVYTRYGQAAATIRATVVRRARAAQADGGPRYEYDRELIVSNVDVSTVNEGGDTVALKKHLGDASNTTYTVVRVIGQTDNGRVLGLK